MKKLILLLFLVTNPISSFAESDNLITRVISQAPTVQVSERGQVVKTTFEISLSVTPKHIMYLEVSDGIEFSVVDASTKNKSDGFDTDCIVHAFVTSDVPQDSKIRIGRKVFYQLDRNQSSTLTFRLELKSNGTFKGSHRVKIEGFNFSTTPGGKVLETKIIPIFSESALLD